MGQEIQAVLGIQVTLVSIWVLVFSVPSESLRGVWTSIALLLAGTAIVGRVAYNSSVS